MSKYEPLTDEEIVSLTGRLTREAVSFHDSELSDEREVVLQYYDGDAPRRSARATSSYVSQDVYDSTEQATAAILEVFTGNGTVGKFAPVGPEDVAAAEQATRYCDHVIFEKNDGFEFFQTAIKDGLMGRNGLGKVYWDEEETFFTEEFFGLSEDEVEVLIDHDEFHELEELAQDNETGLYEGRLIKRRVSKQVRLENIAPEEFGITPRARTMETAPIVFHRMHKTISDLIEMGLTEEEIQKARGGEADIGETDPEQERRFEGIDESTSELDEPAQEQGEEIWLYESYLRLDIDGNGVQRLWKIIHANSVLIHKEPVDFYPFIWWAPVPRSHSFWGNNWAEKIVPTQNAKTTLTRGILDHVVATNRPRYEVVKGTLKSAKEITDDRFGGVINVNRPDSIKPLPQGQLNSFTFPTLQLLQDDLEDTTGVSSLMTGLNKDAISKQNSADMVQQLTTMSQARLKTMARNFANHWVRPLYRLVYRLAMENDDTQTIIEINGDYVPINPTNFKERSDFKLEYSVGYGEKEKAAQRWLQVDGFLSQSAPSQYGPQQKFRVLSKALENFGIKDTQNYLIPEPPPPPPDPFAVAQLQMEQRKMQLEEAKLQLEAAKLQGEQGAKVQELLLAQQKERNSLALAIDKQDLAEQQHEAKQRIAEEELELLKKGQNNPDQNRGIISPNS